MGEIGQRVGSDATRLGPIFAEVARRESTCSSKAQGGDLGLFGPGKMVPEFDAARPQGPGGPARAYRYRLALRRPYRYRLPACGCGWMVAEACRGLGWLG